MTSRARNPLLDPRIAAPALRVSGVIGGVGVVFLVAMFAAFGAGARSLGMTLGWINDVTGVVTMPIALPGMLALHERIRPHAGRGGDALLVLGVGSAGAISLLQLLLVTRVLTFEQEVGPVTIAYLGLGVWFVLTGRIAQRQGVLPGGTRLGVFAALLAGYPFWAFRLARMLEAESAPLGESATA
jgi:hypothetical protein